MRFRRRSRFPVGAAAAVLLAAAAALPVFPQEVEEEAEDLLGRIRELRILLNMGTVAFQDLDFARAVRDLSGILDPYLAGQMGALSVEESGVVARALELRGRAFFNLGQAAPADRDFEALVRLRVDYALDRERISPKEIDLWDKVRSRLVGALSVEVVPVSAEVRIDGEPAGLGPRVEKDLLAGTHEVRVEEPGYAAVTESVEVAAGTVVKRAITLGRNARDIRLFTVPEGVEVIVDDRPAGTTSGTASAEFEAFAERAKVPRRELSGPLMVRNLAAGEYRIRFEKNCYAPTSVRVQVVLDPLSDSPQDFQPVVLERSEATLDLQGAPWGEILLDGKPAGKVPREIARVCSGTHRIEVRGGEEVRWFETVNLRRGDRRVIETFPRPTLAWLGIYSRGPSEEIQRSAGEILLRGLEEGGRFNRIVSRDEEGESGGLGYLQSGVKGILSRGGPEIWEAAGPLDRTLLDRLRGELGADLALVGTAGGETETIRLFLYETGVARPDRFVVSAPADAAGWAKFLDRLGEPFPDRVPWFGAVVADTLLHEGPVVVRVSPGSPSAAAGLRPGDEILAAAGKPVRARADLVEILRGARPGEGVAVDLRRDGKPLRVEVKIGEMPWLVPLDDPGLLYAPRLAEFRLRARTAPDERERDLALLNLGIAYLHFGEPGLAIEKAFRRVELPPGPGISLGTVQYFLGISHREMGEEARATEPLRRAAAEAEATLESPDGPRVAPRAERLLRSLS